MVSDGLGRRRGKALEECVDTTVGGLTEQTVRLEEDVVGPAPGPADGEQLQWEVRIAERELAVVVDQVHAVDQGLGVRQPAVTVAVQAGLVGLQELCVIAVELLEVPGAGGDVAVRLGCERAD